MAALGEHCIAALAQQAVGCGLHLVHCGNGCAALQQHQFVKIGCDQTGERKQLLDENGDGVRFNQPRAAGGDHDGVKNNGSRLPVPQSGRHHPHQIGRVQHADFHRINTYILKHRIDLRADHFGRQSVNGGNAQCILRRNGGDGAHAKTAQRGKGFEIGLNTGAAARIRTRDGQKAGVALGNHGFSQWLEWVERNSASMIRILRMASCTPCSNGPMPRMASEKASPCKVY